MTRIFDTVVIVDWSSRSAPSPAAPTADAIWIGAAGAAAAPPRYLRTRAAAIAWLGDALAEAASAGRRTLVGFDFPFGYPRGLAAALTGEARALAVWQYLADRVEDGPDNANNRFDVAAAINAQLPGQGPYWGWPERPPHLLRRGSLRAGHGLPERRLVEDRIKGAKSCWQLSGNGSVGGQVLTGLPALQRLRRDPRLGGRVAVWPLEGGLTVPDAPVVLAEVYPSLIEHPPDAIRDRAQVAATARALAALDAVGALAPLFAGSPDLTEADRRAVAAEEAWMLGAGHEAALRAAARPATPRLRNDCFAMPPGVDWVPVEAALARLRAGLAPVAAIERLAVAAAGGRILAEPVVAARDHPPAANAAVDGFGFAHASLGSGGAGLALVAGRAAAGAPFAGAVLPGQAVRILTGAVLPEGVDTVVLEEDTERAGSRVHFERGLKPGANTRPAGEDVRAGATILPAGRRLAPQDLGLAAATGVADVAVRRPLRVGVLSTGDELAAPGAAVPPHRTFDANRPMLLEILRRWDVVPVDLGHAADDAGAVAAALDRGAAAADAILTSGGASAGDEDHVSAVLRARGALKTWRIAVKPGRPLALGLWAGVPVFGLPGNPVAAFVCTLIFARPALAVLGGGAWETPRGVELPAAFAKSKKPGRREYLRARPTPDGRVEVFRSEGSGRISGLVWARGLVELDDPGREIAPGDPVRYLPFSEFGLPE